MRINELIKKLTELQAQGSGDAIVHILLPDQTCGNIMEVEAGQTANGPVVYLAQQD